MAQWDDSIAIWDDTNTLWDDTDPRTAPLVEMYINGTWTDITTYVRYQDMIEITRGRSSEAPQLDTSNCSFTLDNRDGRFSPRNPEGAYFGQIGRNTPVRVSIDGGLPYLNLTGASGGRATTPDVAALDITGDLDVRVEMFLLDWDVTTDTEIIGKYLTTGNQRSWRFFLDTGGFPALTWSANGSATILATATTALATNGRSRMAIRATLDVNDGAGNNVVTFYTADDISGAWTQLGNAVTTAGTTSIFASTATLDIGDINNSTLTPMTGRVYAAKVLNGIGGTEVANPDFTAQTLGATAFTDAAGRSWTIDADASLINRHIRFTGEAASWELDWDISGKDAVTRLSAAGIIRRLTQGGASLRSPMFRDFTNPSRAGILAYWPMEEDSNADSFASGIEDHPPMDITGGRPSLSSATPYDGSEALPEINDGLLTAAIPSYTTTGETVFFFLMAVPADGVPAESVLFTLNGTGTVRRWEVTVSTAGSLKLLAYDADGAELTGNGFVAFAVNDELNVVLLELTQNGSNVDWVLRLRDYTNVVNLGDSPSSSSTSGTISSKTVGRIKSAVFGNTTSDLGSTAIGHASLGNDLNTFDNTTNPILGWRLENPTSRFIRVVQNEEGIPLQTHSRGLTGNDVRMGVQMPIGIVDLVREIGDTDLGIMFEPRDEIAIAYRSRLSLSNQDARLTLDHAQNELSAPPIPVDDDQNTRNDITVKREGGSQYRKTLETGALSVQDPPDGVGQYESSVTISLAADDMLPNQAGWRLHLGTVDEARYPRVSINLRHSTFASSTAMMDDALTMDIGDRIVIQNPPSWLPPDDIELLAVGFTETLGVLERDIVVNCVPESPWHIATVEGSAYERADTDGSTLTSGITSTATSVSVTTQANSAVWINSASYASQFPFDVRVGGEVMTVTAVTGTTSPQTFTVTRSVNGVVKTHSAGADLRLDRPAIIPL